MKKLLLIILTFTLITPQPCLALRPMARKNAVPEQAGNMDSKKPTQIVLLKERFVFSPEAKSRKEVMFKINALLVNFFDKFNHPEIDIFESTVLDKTIQEVLIGDISLIEILANSADAIGIRWFHEKYAKKYKGVIAVKVLRRKYDLIIEVEDNGFGIDEVMLSRLFTDLVRSKKEYYPVSLGLIGRVGRGLRIIWVTSIGGTIEINTFYAGKGYRLISSASGIERNESNRRKRGTKIKFSLPGFLFLGNLTEEIDLIDINPSVFTIINSAA